MGCSIKFGIRSAQKEVLTFWLSFAFAFFVSLVSHIVRYAPSSTYKVPL